MFERWQEAARPSSRIGRSVETHASIGSTNDRARELVAGGDGDGRAVVAEEQTAGRGRRGRAWVSPPGVNLTASVALRPRLAGRDAWQLGLAAALAAADACGRHAPIGLKWPNDVVSATDGRKLGGLLVETMAEGEQLVGAVVGIGINVNWRRASMPPDIAPYATSLADLRGTAVDRVELLHELFEALEREVTLIEGGTSPLERYRRACLTLGARVTVRTADGELTGEAAAIDDGGSLVIEDASGRHAIASGELVRVEPAMSR